MMRAALFDVGDTLIDDRRPREVLAASSRARLVEAFGERDWYGRFIEARHGGDDEEPVRQETLRWVERWLRDEGIPAEGLDLDVLRDAMVLPFEKVGMLTPGAPEALRWCRARGLRVVLVSNTLWRGDADTMEDWRRFGLADAIDGYVTSHTTGWRKPHPAMFRRALEIARCEPSDAFMVGDRLRADIWGAKQVGLRTVWRIPKSGVPQSKIDVTPDLTVDELTELPAGLAPWLL